MFAQLTPQEVLAKEIENMEGRKTSLLIAVKAAEAKLKELREQVTLTEIECRQKIEAAQLAYEAERKSLTDTVEPLKSALSTLRAQATADKQLAEKRGTVYAATIQENQRTVDRLNAQIAAKQTALNSVSAELTALKAKVAGL